MEITIRDLIQYLLVHTDLNDTLYYVEITTDKQREIDEDLSYNWSNIIEWKEEREEK